MYGEHDMKALLLTIAAAVVAAGPAIACQVPSALWCLGNSKPDAGCRGDVDRYLVDEDQYRKCVRDEAHRKIQESVARSDRIANRWNCLADGRRLC
jgi:hypothetical protein